MSDFSDRIAEALSADGRLEECRVIRAHEMRMMEYPLRKPLICVGRIELDRLGFLLGSDDCLCGSEKLTVSVTSDSAGGGAYCEEIARLVCTAVLENDSGREIVSVRVDKCMYDRAASAYKVMMGFTLREGSLE